MAKRLPRILVEIYQNQVHEVWSEVPLKCIVRNLDLTKIRQFKVKVWSVAALDGVRKNELEMMEEISDQMKVIDGTKKK